MRNLKFLWLFAVAFLTQAAAPVAGAANPPTLAEGPREFDAPLPSHLDFTRLPDGDVYAPEVGFIDDLPCRAALWRWADCARSAAHRHPGILAALVESRRNRPEEFFKVKAGRIELCNMPPAVRERH